MLRHLTLQRILISGLLLAILLAAVRFLAIQGFLAPVRVTSGSMAPWLLGEHFQVVCGECGIPFAVGFESQPLRADAICPNCGSAKNRLKAELRKRGQRVLIDRGAYWHDTPKRFDVVAFNEGEQSGRMIVKRIVGLPGERLAIRRGELFIDGKLVHKSLTQFRRLSVPVHDNDFLPLNTTRLPARWRPGRDDSGWKATETVFQFTPAGTPANDGSASGTPKSDLDWLVYHHWRCYSSPYPRTSDAPVSDNFGYNQGESRALQDVTDVMLRCTIAPAGPGWLAIRVHDGLGWLTLTLHPISRRAMVDYQGNELASVAFPANGQYFSFVVEFGIIDQQAVFALNRVELIRQVYVSSPETRRAIAQPLAIGAGGLSMEVRELTVCRDVYYLEPANRGESWERIEPFAAGEYFLLGDNPSLSEDSRHWAQSCIPGAMIRGKILPLPW